MSRPARRLLPLGLVFACFGALQAHAADLTVTLQGVRAQTGVLKLAVVDSQAGWDGQAQPVKADGAPPQGEAATFVFKDLAPGAYAVLVTHDMAVAGRASRIIRMIDGQVVPDHGADRRPGA